MKNNPSKPNPNHQTNGKKEKTQPLTKADVWRLIHDLEVRQTELEMQNEALIQARAQAEEAYRQYTDLYDFAPVGYFTLTQNGTVLKVNLAGANLLGVDRNKLRNRRLERFVSEKSLPALSAFLEKLSTCEGKATCEFEFLKNGVGLCHARLEATCFEGGQESRAVMVDITERKRAEELIHQYNNKLEKQVSERTAELVRANRVKDEFLAAVSHELRTPLNGVLGFSELLLEGVRGPLSEKQLQAVRVIQSSGEYLLELINEILDVSRIESGKFEIDPQYVDVDEICQSSLGFINLLASKKSITVKYTPPPASAAILADPKRLKQMLINLLNNAVKFTPEKGVIKLKVQADAGAGLMRFSVSDTGIGIEAENLSRIFEPFVQVDSSLSRRYEGTGLGLMLVKKLAEMHGGSVEVRSEFGSGSCFTLILPWKA
jgi:PAS domain S-box-containing protein